jgi:hypothetical protein
MPQKKKTPGRATEWTTSEQKAWLEGRKPAYRAAQTDGGHRFRQFWVETFDGWFSRWPLEPLNEQDAYDETAEMVKIRAVSLPSFRFHWPLADKNRI